MKIERIKLKNFRRFNDAEFELNPDLNIFVGPNNAGKTSILEAVGLLFGYGDKLGNNQLTKPIETGTCVVELFFKFDVDELSKIISMISHEFSNIEVFDDLKKIGNLSKLSKITFNGKLEKSFSDGRLTRTNKKFWVEEIDLKNFDARFHPIIKRAFDRLSGHNFINLFNSTTYLTAERRAQLAAEPIVYFNQLKTRLDDVKFVRNRLFFLKQESQQEFEQLKQKVRDVFDFEDFDVEPNFFTGQINLNITSGGIKFDIAEMGSGTKSFLLLFSHIYLSGMDIVLIDEPEENLHPSLINKLAIFLKKLSENIQFIVTSHNELFIKQFELHQIYRVEYLEEQQFSAIKKMDVATDFDSLLELLGITLSTYERAQSRFAKIIVFTEGQSDKEYIEKFAAKTNKLEDIEELRPIFYPLEGKWNHYRYVNPKFIERISERKLPLLLILDRDEDCEEEICKIEEKIGKNRVHYLSKREIENYLIVPDVIIRCLKKKTKGRKKEIQELIDSLTLEMLSSKLDEFAEQLKPKIVLIKFLQKILPYRFFYPNEMREFIDSHIEKNNSEIVRDLSAQLYDKITSINREELEKMLEIERSRIDEKWENNSKFDLCPGKDMLSKLNKWLQDEYRINLSGDEIIDELDFVDQDILDLLDKIRQFDNVSDNVSSETEEN